MFWKKVTKISAQFKISSNASESLSQGIILVNICLWRSREQRFQPWPPPSQTGPPSQLKISSNASEYRASLSQVQEAGQGLGPACCTLYAAHCMLHTLCCSLHAAHNMLLNTACCSSYIALHCFTRWPVLPGPGSLYSPSKPLNNFWIIIQNQNKMKRMQWTFQI